jgi:protein O-GlcNAc transferase
VRPVATETPRAALSESADAKTFAQAVAAYQQDRLAEAEELCRELLGARSDHFDAARLLGVVCGRRGRPAEALAAYDQALAIRPDHAETLSNRGNTLKDLGRLAEALASYDRALAAAPRFAQAHYNRGVVLNDLDRLQEALASYDRALAVRPRHAETLNNRGNALRRLNRLTDALASYDAALAARPQFAEALNNRGVVLHALKRYAEALASYDLALAIAPAYADAHHNRGVALKELRRYGDALASFEQVLVLRPDDVAALVGRADALKEFGRVPEALASYERASALMPSHQFAFSAMVDCAIKLCDWERQRAFDGDLRRRIHDGAPVIFPLVLLGYSDEAALHFACAKSFSRSRIEVMPAPLWRGEIWRNGRIRLAYLSADFHEHPVGQLTAELFERHDRSRFEVFGISSAPDDGSALRARLRRAFDRFHDVRAMSDREVAALLHVLHIDIAVDLTGYTHGCRLEILAHRPAPVQVSYLGYPGTTGTSYVDYILADKIILPFDRAAFYSEKIVHLPDCYQANESRRRIDAATPTRRQAGLPDDGFVFSCFNNHLKITAAVFDVWMRLLAAVEGSVLWLSDFNGVAAANLRQAAATRGIAPSRVIFAPRTARLDDHLARLGLAGLFLDTLPYNAHTTASDALWAGLPVLTCRGESLAARVAASLLQAVGLPELVTTTLADYEALALRLATDAPLLNSFKARLERNRLTSPLFNGDRFRRHIEAAYTKMWEISQRGEPPQSFAVAGLGS